MTQTWRVLVGRNNRRSHEQPVGSFHSLKVMARSTVFRYKGVDIDPREAGHRLGVRKVMMGIVQQVGEQLIISAELVDVEDGSRIWV